MSQENDLRLECVRILSELLPALSGVQLPPRADNLAFQASNVLAKLGVFAAHRYGSARRPSEPKAAVRESGPAPPGTDFVYRDCDWPAPANGAPLHGVAEFIPLLNAPLPAGAVPSEVAFQVNEVHRLLHPEAEDPDFGVDPEDSQRLLALYNAIDEHLGWASPESEEAGDYVARVAEVGNVVRNERAAIYELGRKVRADGKAANEEAQRIGLGLYRVVAYPEGRE
jgi:hypothetical protein